MRNGLQNFIAYCYMCYTGKARLDKKQTDIHQTLVLIGFLTLIILAAIGFIAILFWITPQSIYSTHLA